MQQNQPPEYLNMTAASALAGVSRQWMQQLLKAGGVPGVVDHGGFRLFERAAFAPWAEAFRQNRKRPLTKK